MNVATTLEAVGLMVYQRLLSLNTARDLMGGLVVGSWQRLDADTSKRQRTWPWRCATTYTSTQSPAAVDWS